MMNWQMAQKLAALRRRETIEEVELDRLIWECQGADASHTDPALAFGLVDALLSFAAFLLLAGVVGVPLL